MTADTVKTALKGGGQEAAKVAESVAAKVANRAATSPKDDSALKIIP